MSFVMETSEEIGGSASDLYLQQPGTYHCVVTDLQEGRGPKGNPINGFLVGLSVLDGTVEGQKDKQHNLLLFSPDLSKSQSSQEWSKKKQTAFVVATGLLDLSRLGQRVEIDLQQAVGRQIVLTFAENEHDGKKNLELAYANIYHVDDPRAAKFPKDKEALGIVPKSLRKPAEYFDGLLKKSNAPAKPQSRLSDDQLADL
jgi:hypothetical protein